MSKINVGAIRRRSDRGDNDLTAAKVDRSALLDLCEDLTRQLEDSERERDALRAENVVLREALEGIQWMGGSNDACILPSIENRAEQALNSAPLTTAAAERWAAMERVVTKATQLRDECRKDFAHGPTMRALRDELFAELDEMDDAALQAANGGGEAEDA